MSNSGRARVTLLILTLNEIDGMKAIMPQIQKEWYDQLIVVDGGSTDGTIEWARENGYFVHVQKKKGIRFAYFEVLPLIDGDIIISFSPDGNCIPRGILELRKKMEEGYDLVIASRYFENARSQDDDLITAFGNWLFTKTVNVLHHGNYTDAMVIYRAFRTQLIYDLELNREEGYVLAEKLFRTTISWEPLMAVRAARSRKRIAEIPLDEPERIGGDRKLQILKWGAAYYFQFFREVFTWKK